MYKFLRASSTLQSPFTSTLNFAFGLRTLIIARRATSSLKFWPTLTLNVSTPGNELTNSSIFFLSLSAGMVPFIATDVR